MLCLFEDRLASNFLPIAATRHVAHLLVGCMTLRTRAVRATGERRVTLHGRRSMREYHGAMGEAIAAPTEPTLFVNARFPLDRGVLAGQSMEGEWILHHGGDVMVARLEPASIARLDWSADALDFTPLADVLYAPVPAGAPFSYLWDMIADNGPRIAADVEGAPGGHRGTVMPGAHLLNPGQIGIGASSVIQPGVVIDATGGPVVIGEDVEVMPNAVIEGPCCIGDHCRVKIGARIYGSTSIGPWCKVGGEVENSIILGYSNKQHDGFLGHSYLGCWVNLGADTNTSDLKNNYGSVRVTIDGREIDTGRMFLGSLIGDHAKTGINTMLNTGTIIGVAANVFGGGFPPKSIPDFAWGSDADAVYRLDEALAVAKLVMARRTVAFTPADEALLRALHARRTSEP